MATPRPAPIGVRTSLQAAIDTGVEIAVEVARHGALAARIRRHPRASREALLAFQAERLGGMVRRAAQRVPFWEVRFRETGVDPASIRSAADLAQLPLLDRGELRRVRRREMLDRDVDTTRIALSSTSGSTGEPFGVWRTFDEARRIALFRGRAHRQMGIGLRDRVVSIVEPRDRDRDPRHRGWRRRLGLRRGARLSCHLPVPELAERLYALAPDAVVGYPSTLSRLATHLGEHGRGRIAPRVVYTGGERLDTAQRERIRAGFGARVFDVYGTVELDLVAWECPANGGLHLCEDNFVAEILRDGEPVKEGEVGELVATPLHNSTMPLLRYRLGDLVERGPTPCPCGQPFATLTRVHGRAIEYLVLPDGRTFHPFRLTGDMLRDQFGWIDRHQLVQEAPDRVVLRIVAMRPPPPEARAAMEATGREILGPRVRFTVELVQELEPGPGGKFQPYLTYLTRLDVP